MADTPSKFCTVERMRSELARVALAPSLPGDARAAAEEADALARAAFDDGDADARHHAERVLYAIHAYNNFRAPVQEIPAIVWGVLVRAKLRCVLVDLVGQPTLGAEPLRRVLAEQLAIVDERDHVLLEHLDARRLALYGKNWFTSTHGFEEQLLATFHASPSVVKRTLWENLEDEFGGPKPHRDLRNEQLVNFGLRFDGDAGGVLGDGRAFHDPDVATEAFALANVRTAFSLLHDASWSLGSFYSVEACFVPVCRRMTKELDRTGLPPASIAFWSMHAETDLHHAAEWLEALIAADLGQTSNAQIANGALIQLRARSELFAAMKQRFAAG